MIWVLIVLLAAAALAPLGLVLARRARGRGTRDLAVALHRTQLLELDRDLAEGRILPSEHATAVLEVQRRLLAAAGSAEQAATSGSAVPIAVVLVVAPVLAVGLYALTGQPGMPSVNPAAQQSGRAEEASLINQLRDQLAAMDPASDRARQGYVLLGNIEEARGNDGEAASAWRRALSTRFDPSLAARTAEAEVRAKGGVSDSSAALFRRALAAAPDAPWRTAAEQRLQEPRLP